MKKFYFIAIMLMMFSVYMGCKKDKVDEDPTPPTYTNGEGEIGEIGGTVTISDATSPLNGVTVIIPEGALSTEQTIEIKEAPEGVYFTENSSVQLIQLLPEGLTFKKPITIKIPYTGTDTSRLGIFYYDPESYLISELPKTNINITSKTISAITDHFSLYAAWDRTFGVIFNMIKVHDNTIGVSLMVGYGLNEEFGLKNIQTTFGHRMATGESNVWQVLSNNEYTNIYSDFHVILYEDELIGKDPVASAGFEIQRVQPFWGGAFAADIYKRNASVTLYQSGDLITQDIGAGYTNMGKWFSGDPLIFLFEDFTPDPDKKYFVKLIWALSTARSPWGHSNFTPIFEVTNKPDKQNISSMSFVDLGVIDNDGDYIQDDYQVWNENQEPICNFQANQTTAVINENIQFTDQSTNNPTSWNWNFGDGGTSTQKNPTHSYSTQGNYTVSLEVSNQYGSDTKTIENYIQVATSLFIEVITPNGNEEWQLGTTHELTWDDNITENVKIQLWNGNTLATNISTSTISDGSFTWNMTNGYDISDNYKIKIISTNNSSIYDESNNTFSIIEEGSIQVTNPNSSTTWTMGQYNVPISWETGNLGGTVTIQMYKGDNKLGTLTSNTTNNGTYNEYDVQTTLAEGDDYRIKVILNANSDKYDYSEYFNVIAASNLPPTIPQDEYPSNGATEIEINDAIFWTSTDPENDPLTYDIYFGTSTNPPLSVSNETDNYYSLTDLNAIANTTYYWKIVVKDDQGNSTTGPIWSFSTESSGNAPIADFTSLTTSGYTPLMLNFSDESTNNPTSWLWDFGDGVSNTQQNPSHTYITYGSFTVSLTVSNNYGNDTKTKTNYITVNNGGSTGNFTDPRDGETYNTIEIGNQTWFSENLTYESTNSWWYNNSNTVGDIYGRLYTWDAALIACPNGWHLPNDNEWKTMEMALGMSQSEADETSWRGTNNGLKLKEVGTTHWNSPNTGSTNSSGFTALPGGRRRQDGGFDKIHEYGYWWSSSEYSDTHAWRRILGYDYDQVYRGNIYKTGGYSVRCIKN